MKQKPSSRRRRSSTKSILRLHVQSPSPILELGRGCGRVTDYSSAIAPADRTTLICAFDYL